ncbi:putative pentatricopeptide repeat-containing protein At3g23330 isoform X2 [Cryptomeria japonica]|uniref:putative pentatricopeptide repeat-containing protein At3g23330 isoform X2 n=1 Tax=Cryptomeria japonica TaxID=3369 RepID=UPI0027DA98BF|nr:putative pentatricopeptide repeat-containing protein At3g23330 isoform X2 [Cryptomeria japonica]
MRSQGYVQSGCSVEAWKLFRQMLLDGIDSNPMTLTIVLPVCSYSENLQLGKMIHGYVVRRRFDLDIFVGSALIDFYAKCRRVDVACQLFDRMPEANVVSWTAMIACYAQNEHANDALKCFRRMQLAGVKPNEITIVSVLPACAQLAALQQGKQIHQYVLKIGFMRIISVGNALIDMYSKCGSINIASRVFDKIIDKNVVSWSAMIAGFGMHGKGESALELFNQMQYTAIEPDYVTFIGVLSACSHAGLVDEGWQYFNMMREKYGISHVVEHYACMVDLLGRAGQLHEAQTLIEKMPLEPSSSVWGALLAACRVHSNLELGEHAFKWILKLEPENVGNYILLANIYAAVGRWDRMEKVRIMMKKRSLRKVPGYSWILVKNSVHTFLVGDESHPKMNDIHATLKNLVPEMMAVGYVPDFHSTLYDNG